MLVDGVRVTGACHHRGMIRREPPLWRLDLGIGQRAVTVGLFALLLVVAASELSVGVLSATIIGAVMVPLSAIGIYRAARAGVIVDSEGVISRTLERTQRVRWCEINSVGTAGTARGTAMVMLTTRRGKKVVLRGIAGFATSTHLDRLDDIARYLEQVRAMHQTRCPRCAREA